MFVAVRRVVAVAEGGPRDREVEVPREPRVRAQTERRVGLVVARIDEDAGAGRRIGRGDSVGGRVRARGVVLRARVARLVGLGRVDTLGRGDARDGEREDREGARARRRRWLIDMTRGA